MQSTSGEGCWYIQCHTVLPEVDHHVELFSALRSIPINILQPIRHTQSVFFQDIRRLDSLIIIVFGGDLTSHERTSASCLAYLEDVAFLEGFQIRVMEGYLN